MIKKLVSLSVAAVAASAFVFAPVASAAATVVVTPTSSVYDANNVVGVVGDHAPGFKTGSLASDGSGKTDMYFSAQALFGRSVTLGEISSISYWTKTGATHTAVPADWSLVLYTAPYDGDASAASWYGDRIGAEPYFSANLSDPANTWNNWSTGGETNQLRFFESTAGAPGANFGAYTDPNWAEFVAGSALSGQAYATRTLSLLSLQTGSAWADGFTGQIDGLVVTLADGTTARVNFEAAAAMYSKDDCKDGGWENLVDAGGKGFKNQGQCVSYAAKGGVLGMKDTVTARTMANNPRF